MSRSTVERNNGNGSGSTTKPKVSVDKRVSVDKLASMLADNGYVMYTMYIQGRRPKRDTIDEVFYVMRGQRLMTAKLRRSSRSDFGHGCRSSSYKVSIRGADVTIVDCGGSVYMVRAEDFPGSKSIRFGIDSTKNNDKVMLLGSY